MNKKTVHLFIGLIVIVAVTVPITLLSGSFWGRWGTFDGMEESQAALKSLPMVIGSWEAEEERELDETSITMLRIQDSYITRSYKNKETQAVVHVTLMVGPTGKITVHTPVVCFGGKDFIRLGDPVSVPIDTVLPTGEETVDAFWRVDFQGQSIQSGNKISFYWGVSTGGHWQAEKDPRSAFQMYRYVYKIQAESYVGSGSSETDNVKQFLEDCLPTIRKHMIEQ